MTTYKQKEAAKKNINKAQRKRRETAPRKRALVRPGGRWRAKPGTKGEGDYFRIVVRTKDEFTTFRYQDVGEKGHILRLAGKRSSGSWDTQAWLIGKNDAHIKGDTLIADTNDAKRVIQALGSKPTHVKGDIFTAKDKPNVPESEKPTGAQQKARLKNIKKAQQARRTRISKKG
ncbi:MAG: hypothetical protein ABSC61_03080 [Anaerolineales bacterium]